MVNQHNTAGKAIKVCLYLREETKQRLEEYIINRYGRAAKASSLIMDEALNYYLDSKDK